MEKKLHFITLPALQAQWWAETCVALGIFASVFGPMSDNKSQVMTSARPVDLDAAWSLFVEEFKEKLE